MLRATTLSYLTPLLALAVTSATSSGPEAIRPNENRHAAGALAGKVLTVKLEAREGVWRPEGDNGRAISVAAWAEEGKPLSNPGPLIRVPVGTEVRATIHNTLAKPLIVSGFGKTRGMSDSVIVPVNGRTSVSFTAAAPGTYYYVGRRGVGPFGTRPDGDFQLNGAIVVDPPNAPTTDRVFIISWWFTLDSTSKTGLGRATMAINGLSWPHTERIELTQGDSAHWRVINLTEVDHPMHLHGFYFRVTSHGNGVVDSLFRMSDQQMAVTDIVNPFQTMSMAWLPSRPGNWIFHCHFASHLSQDVALDADKGELDASMLSHHMSDRPHQMFGLVLGLTVAPHGPQAAPPKNARAIRLAIREKANVYGKNPGFSFVMGGTPEDADPSAMPVPGPALVLQRNQPVAVTIVNQAKERAAVHWHGIELESYPDGVPDWSGSKGHILPSVGPRDSITIRFTPPRAGTFMYHSHFDEATQIAGGLYGPIIVLDSGQKFDAETDRVLVFGIAGPATNVVVGPFSNYLMNGKAQPAPMNLAVGKRYRFRVINITDDGPMVLSLNTDDKPVQWRAIARDGATLPERQATFRPAMLISDPGQIYDFEFTPQAAGEMTLKFGPPPPPPGSPPPPPGFPPPPPTVTVPVHVR
ncbi:MAG TPA: multicopper oxidase domain-containing protein [Gemmatimonadaceae bacterium]|jgi:FtsP/CotA-like multicopper oxidase with cupredoxin domain|nr:multicopper oxidase domain-containing protein [Gemmatimonadaceae bacterium]